MSENQISDYYEEYLKRKALFSGFGYDVDSERSFILEQANPVTGRILEAGTGKGHFALTLAKAGYTFTTFDISEDEQRCARWILSHFGFEQSADFRIENGEHTSFSDASFDVVFCVNVLHHLQNPYQFLDELWRVVSLSGKIVLADFTQEGFRVVDRIHRLDGHVHETGQIALADAKNYLSQKVGTLREARSIYQHVIIASKKA